MQFDPQRSLFELAIVRRTVALTVVLSSVMTIVIAINTPLEFEWDDNAFNTAATTFKIPLAVLALGFTLIGIYGANHRSEQTKRQIERTTRQIMLTRSQIRLTQGQNKFSNYYKHFEEFEKYCKKRRNHEIEFSSPRDLYRKIFPRSRKGEYSADRQFVLRLESFMTDFINLAEQLNTTNRSDYRDTLIRIALLRQKYMQEHRLNDIGLSGTELNSKAEPVIIPDGTPQGLFKRIAILCDRVDQILRFDHEYEAPPMLVKIVLLKTAPVPALHVDADSVTPFSIDQLMDPQSKSVG